MTKLNKQFTATLENSGANGDWTYVVMPGSAEFFGMPSKAGSALALSITRSQ